MKRLQFPLKEVGKEIVINHFVEIISSPGFAAQFFSQAKE